MKFPIQLSMMSNTCTFEKVFNF